MDHIFEPKILAFLCNWCSYAGADLAGVSRFQYPTNIRVIRTMCSGRVDPVHVIEGLKSGFDGVFVFGCHFGDCHYLEGNYHTARRMQLVGQMLDIAGIGKNRLQLRWVSAAEGQLFADYVTELTELIREMGPLRASRFQLSLAAVQRAMHSSQLRWLLGMDRFLTEKKNVYDQQLNPVDFQDLLQQCAEQEYQKALLVEALQEGPQTVRQMAKITGLPVYCVSRRLNDLERTGLVDLQAYEGTSPTFTLLTA
ncbi:hydrogenase iron-sulfur subunit [Desulfobacca acetoxidans]